MQGGYFTIEGSDSRIACCL